MKVFEDNTIHNLGNNKFVLSIPVAQLFASYASFILNENRPTDDAYIEFTLDILRNSTRGINFYFDKQYNTLVADNKKIPYNGIPPRTVNHFQYIQEILIFLKTELLENKRRLLTEYNIFIKN